MIALGYSRPDVADPACRFMSASAPKETDVLRCREMTLRANNRSDARRAIARQP
jgi:hypothetical protein